MAKTKKSQKIVNLKRYLPQHGPIKEKPTQSATIILFPTPKPFDRLYAQLLPRDREFLDDMLEVFNGDKETTLELWKRMGEGI